MPDPARALVGGLRGGAADQVYESPGLKLILSQPSPHQQPITIEGQIYLSDDAPDATTDLRDALVQMFDGTTLVASAFVDEFSSFRCSVPASGTYTLSLYLADRRVLLDLTLG